MMVTIEYDSVWQTSFLDGDPNKPISKKSNARKFVATSGTRGETTAPITDNTILGILYRLIGDQRKLYQSRKSSYFSSIEERISWRIKSENTVSELLYLTNKSDDRCGKGTWMGVISDDNPWFFSDQSPLLWSVIYLTRDEILDYILSEKAYIPTEVSAIDCRPTSLLKQVDQITNIKSEIGKPWRNFERNKIDRLRIEELIDKIEKQKLELINKFNGNYRKTGKQFEAYNRRKEGLEQKATDYNKRLLSLGSEGESLKNELMLNSVVDYIQGEFPENEYWSNGELYPYRIFAAALYLQVNRLKTIGYELGFAINKKKEAQIQGFSKRGFNGVRDWLNPMTGGRKKAIGTPCQIQKQSGRLEITIDVDRQKGKEICEMIECAGVSSFYLGKKGLAYVSDIRV